jgi:hypothetical protein
VASAGPDDLRSFGGSWRGTPNGIGVHDGLRGPGSHSQANSSEPLSAAAPRAAGLSEATHPRCPEQSRRGLSRPAGIRSRGAPKAFHPDSFNGGRAVEHDEGRVFLGGPRGRTVSGGRDLTGAEPLRRLAGSRASRVSGAVGNYPGTGGGHLASNSPRYSVPVPGIWEAGRFRRLRPRELPLPLPLLPPLLPPLFKALPPETVRPRGPPKNTRHSSCSTALPPLKESEWNAWDAPRL